MILVGTFTEQDIIEGKDKIAVQQKQKETGLGYTNTKLVKKKGKIVGIKIWVCSLEDFKL